MMQRRVSQSFNHGANLRALLGRSEISDVGTGERDFRDNDSRLGEDECSNSTVDHTMWHRLLFRTVPRIQAYACDKAIIFQRFYPELRCAMPYAWDAAHWVLRLWGDQKRLDLLRISQSYFFFHSSYLNRAMLQGDQKNERMVCLCIAETKEDVVHTRWWLERDFGKGENGGLAGVLRTVVVHNCPDQKHALETLKAISELNCVNALCVGQDRRIESPLTDCEALMNSIVTHNPELQVFQCVLDYIDPKFAAALRHMTSLLSLSITCEKGPVDLQFTQMLPKLQKLTVVTSGKFDAECIGLGTLALHCPELQVLRIQCKTLKKSDIVTIAKTLVKLHTLEILNVSTLRGDLKFKHKLRELRYVSFSGCNNLKGVNFLSVCKKLRELDVSFTCVTSAGIEDLAACQMLEKVNFSGCKKIEHISAIGRCMHLREVDVVRSGIRTFGTYASGMFGKLTTIVVEDCDNVVDVSALAFFPLLESITFSRLRIRTLGIYEKGMFPALKEIKIWKCPNILNVEALASYPKLESITLYSLPITTLGSYQSNMFPALKKIEILDCRVVQDVSALAFCPMVKSLTVYGAGLSSLCSYSEGVFPVLECLELSNCDKLNDISAFERSRTLRTLKVSDTIITTLGEYKKGMYPALESVTLERCSKLMDVSVLAFCPKLKSLSLQSLPITTLGTYEYKFFRALRTFTLSDCTHVTDLSVLTFCPHLHYLEVNNVLIFSCSLKDRKKKKVLPMAMRTV